MPNGAIGSGLSRLVKTHVLAEQSHGNVSMNQSNATIRDVAQAAGVSVATASRALTGSTQVLPETRERVQRAAAALHYHPSAAARSLIRRRTDTIGALLPDLHGEYFSELIRGIDQSARSRGLHLLLSSSHDDASGVAAALHAMSGRVDGLILMTPHADAAFLRKQLPPSLPLVLLSTGVAHEAAQAFTVDNFGGAKAMTEHLRRQGHRRIAFLTGPAGNYEARERERGYHAGLDGTAAPWILNGDFSEAAGQQAGKLLAALPQRERPDALFCANDAMAIACMGALHAAGLRVPHELALAGFDDVPTARYLHPALSTVKVPIATLGHRALEALVLAVAATEPLSAQEVTTVLPTELVLRQSCSRPRP